MDERRERIDRDDPSESDRRFAVRRHVRLIGAATVAVVAVAAVAVAVAQLDSGGEGAEPARNEIAGATPPEAATTTATTAAARVTDGASRDAENVASVIEWELVEEPNVAIGWSEITTEGPSIYAISTAPGRGEDRRQMVYTTADGASFTPSGTTIDDLWVNDVDGRTASAVYAIGTAPGENLAFDVVAATSTDSGVTFTQIALPIDTDAISDAGFGRPLAGLKIAARDDTLVAFVPVQGWFSQQPPAPNDVDVANGYAYTDDGLALYGDTTDLSEAQAELCPVGWTLAQGGPEMRGDAANAEGTRVIRGGPGGTGEWHCSPPLGNDVSDTWVEGAQVHGPTTQVIPHDQLDLPADVVQVARRRPWVFASADGGARWERVSLPFDVAATPWDARLMATSTQFVLFTGGIDPRLAVSSNGIDWTELALPSISNPQLSALPDGRVVLIGPGKGELVAATQTDGAWEIRSLDPLLGLGQGWAVSQVITVSTDGGPVAAVYAFRDASAPDGGITIDHEAFSIRLEGQSGMMTLLDRDGDEIDWFSPSGYSASVAHILQMTNFGFNVVDPATGNAVDSFTYEEIWSPFEQEGKLAPRPVAASAAWVLHSVDGAAWSVERLDELGIRGANGFSGVMSTGETVAFRFFGGEGKDGAPAQTLALVGEVPPTG